MVMDDKQAKSWLEVLEERSNYKQEKISPLPIWTDLQQ